MLKVKLGGKHNVTVVAFCIWGMLAGSAMADSVVYADDFDGTGNLSGTVPDAGGTNSWFGNSSFQADGTVSGVRGAVLLDFSPELNKVYTLSVDVVNNADDWLALGFTKKPTADGGDARFTGPREGLSWMLYRNHASNDDVGVFEGPATDNQLGGIALPGGFDFTQSHTLTIVLDTTGDGSSYTSSFYMDTTTVFEDVAIAQSVDDINYVGMSWNGGTSTQTSVDNFSLTVIPEPTTLGLFGVSSIAVLGIRRLFGI